MTVCIATVFTWIYGDGDFGRAILTASDRMLTAGDIQYEPSQQKVSHLSPTTLLMVAGDLAVHTEALTHTQKDIANLTSPNTSEIADIYASYIRRIRRSRAVALYLEPLGLNEASFIANQKNMLPQIVVDITNEIRTYALQVEALVVGCDQQGAAFIFQIDGEGIITHHHDINFAAIGVGSGQAKSYLMFSRYQKITSYFRALPVIYGAKRQAEAAPGVGTGTDYFLIKRDGIVIVAEEYINVIAQHYAEEEKRKSDDAAIIEIKLSNETDAILAKLDLSLPTEVSSAEDASSAVAAQPNQAGPIPLQGEPNVEKPVQTHSQKHRPQFDRRGR